MFKLKKLLASFFIFFTFFLFHAEAQITIAAWNFPNTTDDSLVDASIAANSSEIISVQGGPTNLQFGIAGAATRCAWADGWNAGNGLMQKRRS